MATHTQFTALNQAMQSTTQAAAASSGCLQLQRDQAASAQFNSHMQKKTTAAMGQQSRHRPSAHPESALHCCIFCSSNEQEAAHSALRLEWPSASPSAQHKRVGLSTKGGTAQVAQEPVQWSQACSGMPSHSCCQRFIRCRAFKGAWSAKLHHLTHHAGPVSQQQLAPSPLLPRNQQPRNPQKHQSQPHCITQAVCLGCTLSNLGRHEAVAQGVTTALNWPDSKGSVLQIAMHSCSHQSNRLPA